MESKEIVINSRKWGAVKNPASGKFLELDVWIPDHNLIFEFQVKIIIKIPFFFISESCYRILTTTQLRGILIQL